MPPQAKSAAPLPATGPSSLLLQRKCACDDSSETHECEECASKRRRLQRSAIGDQPSSVPSIVQDVLRSSGRPIDVDTRVAMERRLGHDFSHVRVHADCQAAASAEAVNANAYTVGRHVVFGSDQYTPWSLPGRQLLAHELVHVVQQAHGTVSGQPLAGGLSVSDPNDTYEQEALRVSAGLINGSPSGDGFVEIGTRPAGLPETVSRSIQRQARRSPTRQRASSAPRRALARPPHPAPIVEDRQPIAAGQMHKTEFLTALRQSLISAAEVEFRRIGRSGRDCPYILRSIERYATRPVGSLLRVIRAFAHPPAGADARGMIAAVTDRTRVVARRIADRHGSRAQAAMETSESALPSHDPVTLRAQLGSGSTLDRSTREKMEYSFGTNFASVRVHDDSKAARLNTALGSRAFTVGHDIAFAEHEYRPATASGERLLAHELAHTIQQGRGSTRAASVAAERDLEHEAERVADTVAQGRDVGEISRHASGDGLRVQQLPAVLAGALVVAEATPEVIVVAEVATVSTEVVVADGAIVAASEIAAPTILEAAAPTVAEFGVPALEAAVPETAAISSSTLATTVTAAAATAATTLSSDSPAPTQEDEEEQQQCQAPTGLWPIDPIGITWFKVWTSDYYPTPIEIQGHYYDRDDDTQHLPRGEPIGVSRIFRPFVGKIFQLDPIERGPGADRFRAVLTRYGFDWSGLQADHVQDLQWSGMDEFNNLWPMDASANLSAGPRQNDNQSVTFCETQRGPLRTMTLRQMKAASAIASQYFGRWFTIRNFRR